MFEPRTRRLVASVAGASVLALAVAPRAQAQQGDSSSRTLSLDQALAMAEGVSEDVIIAQTAVERAEGQREKARSQFLPQISGTASYTRTLRSQFQGVSSNNDTTSQGPSCNTFVPDTTAPLDQRVRLVERAIGCTAGGFDFGSLQSVGFGSPNQYNLGLSLQQNLFSGGRVTAQYRASNAGRQSAQIGLTAAKAQLVLDVAQAYYDAQLADRLVTIAEATLAQADSTLSQTRLARQVGNQSEFELLNAQVTRDNQVPVVIQRQAQRDVAYTRLKQLLHVPQAQPLALTTSLGDTTSAPSARVASLLENSPDTVVADRAPVRQALQNVLAQRSNVTIAAAERLPSITLSSSFGRVAFPNGFPDWSEFRTNWTITASLSIPLLTWGDIHGDQVIARADLREAQARLTQTRQLSELDTRNALDQLRTAEAQFAASRGTTNQATRAYAIAEVRYREGISTQTELNESRIQLQQAQANRAQSARDLQVARIRVALLRDLPLSQSTQAQTATTAPATTTMPPTITTPQQPTTVTRTPTVNASQTTIPGVSP